MPAMGLARLIRDSRKRAQMNGAVATLPAKTATAAFNSGYWIERPVLRIEADDLRLTH